LKGRLTIIVRFDPGTTFVGTVGTNTLKLPALYAVIRVEGIGAAIEGALEKDPSLNATMVGTRRMFALRATSPVTGMQPVLEVDGRTFYFATSAEFLQQCLDRQTGLDGNRLFAGGLAALGPDGNGVTWISPRFFSALKQVASMNPDATPQVKKTLELLTVNLPTTTQPLFSVRSNLPEGILMRSNWNKSLKSDIAMFSIYNPVTIGLFAAMAIPAFQKVRQVSQAKSAAMNGPPSAAIVPSGNLQADAMMENLRLLNDAANRFYADQDANTVTLEQLVGPGKYLPGLRAVAGEDYRTVLFKKGRPLRLYLKDGRLIVYPPQ
jgi:type IV pilus assembly protein PilA